MLPESDQAVAARPDLFTLFCGAVPGPNHKAKLQALGEMFVQVDKELRGSLTPEQLQRLLSRLFSGRSVGAQSFNPTF